MSEIDKKEFKRVLKMLGKCGSAVITGHKNPDGDSVGACFALAIALWHMGITPVILPEPYPERYGFLQGREFVCDKDTDTAKLRPDVFICVDCASKDRLPKSASAFDKTEFTINIDHHATNTKFAKYNFVDGNCSSAAELVFRLFEDTVPTGPEYAEAVYTGIVFDTGGFCHSSTSPKTHEVAAKLLAAGADGAEIFRKTLKECTKQQALIFGTALSNLVTLDSGISYSYVSIADLNRCGAVFSDSEGIVEYILNIGGTSVGMLFSERLPQEIKVSFRSVSLDVSEIALLFGGGGHKNAAGASLAMNLEEAVKAAVSAVEERLLRSDVE